MTNLDRNRSHILDLSDDMLVAICNNLNAIDVLLLSRTMISGSINQYSIKPDNIPHPSS
jgi:hypothetical protein